MWTFNVQKMRRSTSTKTNKNINFVRVNVQTSSWRPPGTFKGIFSILNIFIVICLFIQSSEAQLTGKKFGISIWRIMTFYVYDNKITLWCESAFQFNPSYCDNQIKLKIVKNGIDHFSNLWRCESRNQFCAN